MLNNYIIEKICERPELTEPAALWFSDKWGIPKEAYIESMEQCLEGRSVVPQ